MTAKQYLNRARGIDNRINSLLETKAKIKDQLTNITQSYEHDITSGTKDPHKFDRLVIIENQIDELIDQMLCAKSEVLSIVYQVQDWRLQEVLKRRYVDMQSFEQIAYNMNYAWRQVMRLHKKGLQEVEVILHERNETI